MAASRVWRRGLHRRDSAAWGLLAVGLLVLGLDDLLGLHERSGTLILAALPLVAEATNNPDDLVTLGYALAGLTLATAFRTQLRAIRASSCLLVGGVFASGAMVLSDAFPRGDLGALEFPLELGAGGLLLLAAAARWLELAKAGRWVLPVGASRVHPPALSD